VQAVASISFPTRLKKGAIVAPLYLTAAQAEKPGSVPACVGSTLEPTATAGKFCVYRGFGLKGGLETQDQNATEFEITTTNGENAGLENKISDLGGAVVFRSLEVEPAFKEEPAEEPGKITHQTYLSAVGVWAVKEK
jgi:hypothetical protein